MPKTNRNWLLSLVAFLAIVASESSRAGAETPEKERSTFRIAFGSCVMSPVSLIWGAISDKDPDLVLLLGDQIYQQKQHLGNEKEILDLYGKLLRAPGFDKLLATGKVFAIWDDHDFGPNDSDSGHPGRAASFSAFQKIWRPPAGPDDLRKGIAYELLRRGVDILMTDNRTYRWNPGKGGTPTMFGPKQLDWMRVRLRDTKARVMIVASGGQLFSSKSRVDTLNGYAADREILLSAIEQSPVGVIVLSGDRHYAEILEAKLGKRTVLEATSSPLSAPRRPAHQIGVEPNRRALYVGSDNFGLLTLRLEDQVSADVEFFDDRVRLLMARHDLSVR